MPDPVFALTGYATAGALSNSNPQTANRYAYVTSLGKAFYWASNDQSVIDNVTVIGNSSYTGRWKVIQPSEAGAALTNADATIYVSGATWRTIPAGTLTANHTGTLSPLNAVAGSALPDGAEITITRYDASAFTYTLVNGGVGGGNVAVMPISARSFVKARLQGGAWVQHSSGLML
jgi:hypothetical protein